jgi:hypothetical protein
MLGRNGSRGAKVDSASSLEQTAGLPVPVALQQQQAAQQTAVAAVQEQLGKASLRD